MASNLPANRKNGPAAPLSEETVRELLSLQKQELSVRLKVVEREREEISLNKSVAQHSIEAQERDRRHEREEVTKRQRTRQNFFLLAVLASLIFSAYAMHMGKEELVMDMVKVILGFIGGMGYQAFRGNNRRNA